MRACRLFIYPEHEPDNLYKAFLAKDGSSLTNPNQKKWIKSLLNAPPAIWIFNSEYYRFSVDMKKVDTYFGPAAGFKYLDFLNYNPNGKFIFYDYNAESLNWIQKLKDTWDGEDFYKYLQEQPEDIKKCYKFIHGSKFNKENIEKNLNILFKEFGGEQQFKKLWKEFTLGTKSMAYNRSKGRNPFYEAERRRFMDTIVAEMDAAWLGLSDEERNEFKWR
jgi:hypothetical protein